MLCCLCGETIEPGEVFIKVTQHRVVFNLATNREILVCMPLEDGSLSKVAHSACPVLLNNPMALLGANGDRTDV